MQTVHQCVWNVDYINYQSAQLIAECTSIFSTSNYGRYQFCFKANQRVVSRVTRAQPDSMTVMRVMHVLHVLHPTPTPTHLVDVENPMNSEVNNSFNLIGTHTKLSDFVTVMLGGRKDSWVPK